VSCLSALRTYRACVGKARTARPIGEQWRWNTDAFGIVAPNQNPAGLGTFVYNLRFPGQYYQSKSGLNHNYFRVYDPQTERYVESDPVGLGEGINAYAYSSRVLPYRPTTLPT
jgi:RHS repeat-associated protein